MHAWWKKFSLWLTQLFLNLCTSTTGKKNTFVFWLLLLSLLNFFIFPFQIRKILRVLCGRWFMQVWEPKFSDSAAYVGYSKILATDTTYSIYAWTHCLTPRRLPPLAAFQPCKCTCACMQLQLWQNHSVKTACFMHNHAQSIGHGLNLTMHRLF